MSASLASPNIFRFFGILYSPDLPNLPNLRHYLIIQKWCKDLCSINCNKFVVVSSNQIRHLFAVSWTNLLCFFFQINLDIFVPLVVTWNIQNMSVSLASTSQIAWQVFWVWQVPMGLKKCILANLNTRQNRIFFVKNLYFQNSHASGHYLVNLPGIKWFNLVQMNFLKYKLLCWKIKIPLLVHKINRFW